MESEDPGVERGKQLIDELQGEGVGERMHAAMAADSPEFADFAISGSYAAVYDRPRLDVQQRQLVTIGALAAMGGCEPQLERHVLMALRAGLTPAQVFEACIQIAVYAGMARANNAFRVAAAVIAKHRNREARAEP